MSKIQEEKFHHQQKLLSPLHVQLITYLFSRNSLSMREFFFSKESTSLILKSIFHKETFQGQNSKKNHYQQKIGPIS